MQDTTVDRVVILIGMENLDVLFEHICDDDSFGIVHRTAQPEVVSPGDKRALQILETTTKFVGDWYESGLLSRSDSPR